MICTLLRKPLFGNTLGSLPCGVLHIDASRITTSDNLNGGAYVGSAPRHDGTENWRYKRGLSGEFVPPSGRFPANLIVSLSVAPTLDVQSGYSCNTGKPINRSTKDDTTGWHMRQDTTGIRHADSGGASRFFKVVQ